ncbi:MAG: hypothetical protein HYV26_04055 [Candidatus Hydrogenedentes bacterium]|nr:hypothetical protein [Candidatus Hydrogenedentota bacterium]
MNNKVKVTETLALPQPFLGWKLYVVLVILLTLALAPAFWFIRAAATEVTKYSAYSFESYCREALEQQDFAQVLRICAGAARSALDQDTHLGLAYLFEAKAHAGLGDIPSALAHFEAAARFWVRRYYATRPQDRREAEAFGRELGQSLLGQGDSQGALRAYSAAGVASGDPVRYLYDLASTLQEEEKKALWVAEPFIILEDFNSVEAAPAPALEPQAELVSAASIEAASITGGNSATVSLAANSGAEALRLSVPAYVPLGPKPFGLRAYARASGAANVQWLITYWFEAAHVSTMTLDPPSGTLEMGWLEFSIARPFYQERKEAAELEGYAADDGFINGFGIKVPPGPASQVSLDRVDLYLPAGTAPDAP